MEITINDIEMENIELENTEPDNSKVDNFTFDNFTTDNSTFVNTKPNNTKRVSYKISEHDAKESKSTFVAPSRSVRSSKGLFDITGPVCSTLRYLMTANCFAYAFLKYNTDHPGYLMSQPLSSIWHILLRGLCYTACMALPELIFPPYSSAIINGTLGWCNYNMYTKLMSKN